MKWRLEDRRGKQLKIVEAEDRAAADIFGFKTFPGKYYRATDLQVEEAKTEAGLVVLTEAYQKKFVDEGVPKERADRMAEIAARGRRGQ
jgi:hypothetical protein